MNAKLSVYGIMISLLLVTHSIFGADAPAAPNQADSKASDGTTPLATKARPPAATDPPATAPARGGRGNRVQVPATEADMAEIAKLNDLPQYAIGLADGNYSTGPDYAAAPEQTTREGVPQGKIVSFTMDSAESKIFPRINGPISRIPRPSRCDAGCMSHKTTTERQVLPAECAIGSLPICAWPRR